MPFKNLSSPRKVNQLDAEVRATAIHASPELVALLTNDPVRLAIHPVSGAAGKITNISLNQGDDVALLSKDVAVVRSGEAVWALIDITHQPKMEQVARDAKSLHMKPTGGSALALSWDGTATELRLNKHEVDARQFPLRGDVRAADLTATDTFVVVEKGGAGGELRVHPGSTPDTGATWRADLPKDAATLDRLRAGEKMSAVYKRGNASVCIVTATAGRLSAKMIRLLSNPTDIAVLETSLFASFSDGRVAVYDREALANASDSGLEPTGSVHLGARGEPRSISTFSKGSSTLWVGTSAGDVVSVSIVRKSVLV
jgi:hypothetical protein